MKFSETLAYVFALMSISVFAAYGQTPTPTAMKGWLILDDYHEGVAFYQFGVDSNATFAEDQALNEAADLPPPPSGTYYRWQKLQSRGTSQGYLTLDKNDFHSWPPNSTKRDSFNLAFTPDSDYFDIAIRWDHNHLALRWDRVVMWFKSNGGGLLPDSIDMTDAANGDSIVIPQPHLNANNIPFVYILAYGPKQPPIDTKVKEEGELVPAAFGLHQNYPNPFNPSTTITFDLKTRVFADVAVYNLLGQRVKMLHSGELSGGTYSTEWNGTAENGLPVASGVYFIRMNAQSIGTGEQFTAVRKLLLMK